MCRKALFCFSLFILERYSVQEGSLVTTALSSVIYIAVTDHHLVKELKFGVRAASSSHGTIQHYIEHQFSTNSQRHQPGQYKENTLDLNGDAGGIFLHMAHVGGKENII